MLVPRELRLFAVYHFLGRILCLLARGDHFQPIRSVQVYHRLEFDYGSTTIGFTRIL